MATFFVSDIHLDDRRPETTELFLRFLHGEARGAEALYILGDLFEFWLGDDSPPECALQVADALSALKETGVDCFFQHGNRDFLVQTTYAGQAGLKLLPEEFIVDLYGENVLLMHGDSLCTDDEEYLQFRAMVRNPAWQIEFLSRSPQERLQIALQARDASAEHKGKLAMDIMDVNADMVQATFQRHAVRKLIHGHTHRPHVHELLVDGQPARRIVLGDWYTQGSVLRVQTGNYELAEF